MRSWPSFEEQWRIFQDKVLSTDADVDRTELSAILAMLAAVDASTLAEYEPSGGVITDAAISSGIIEFAWLLSQLKNDEIPTQQMLYDAMFINTAVFARCKAQLIIEPEYTVKCRADAAVINALEADQVVKASVHAAVTFPKILIWVVRREHLIDAVKAVVNSLGIKAFQIENTKLIVAIRKEEVEDESDGQSAGKPRGISQKIRDLFGRILGRRGIAGDRSHSTALA